MTNHLPSSAITPTLLQNIVDQCRIYTEHGQVADYIPELKKMDRSMLAVSIMRCGNEVVSAGDDETYFTIQSISKVIALLIALEDQGPDTLFQKVGVEPTGDVFNSIRRLETRPDHKPLNPMINAGAIVVASMIKGKNTDDKFDKILSFMQAMTGNSDLRLNEQVYDSEKRTGDRNRSLAYFMKSTGVITGKIEEALDLYFRFNAIEVTCRDLASIGCFFANEGKQTSHHACRICDEHIRIALAIMMTSGMYNESGEFATTVGFPAKSGVSGGILATVPGQMGIGVFAPAINRNGNSTAGVQVLKQISDKLSLSLFRSP